MNRFYVTSDWHLDAVTAGVRRFSEVRDAVSTVFVRARTEGAGVVFAGDLCNPESLDSHRCTALSVALMVEHQDKVAMAWLTGNHDIVEDGYQTSTLDPLASAGGFVYGNAEQIDFGEFTFGLLPFTAKTHPYLPELEVAGWPNQCDVVIGHLGRADLMPGSEASMTRGRHLVWPTAALAQYQPQATLIGGHYHRGQQVGNLHIVGSPARFNFGEAEHVPSYLSVELVRGRGKKRHVKVERHAFEQVRRVYSIAAADPELPPIEQGDIVRVVHHHGQHLDTAAAESELLARGAAAVRFKELSSPDQAATELVDRPAAATVTAEDGFKAAERLAREWPAADEAFRTQLEQLVIQLGTESR